MDRAIEQLDNVIEELNEVRASGNRLVFLASMTRNLEALRDVAVVGDLEVSEDAILGQVARARLYMPEPVVAVA